MASSDDENNNDKSDLNDNASQHSSVSSDLFDDDQLEKLKYEDPVMEILNNDKNGSKNTDKKQKLINKKNNETDVDNSNNDKDD